MESQLPVVGMDHRAKESKAMQKEFYKVVWYFLLYIIVRKDIHFIRTMLISDTLRIAIFYLDISTYFTVVHHCY